MAKPQTSIQKNTNGKQHRPNRLKELHRCLVKHESARATEKLQKICELCRWSQRTFYRMLETPENLSTVEKITLAEVYAVPGYFIFPELEIVH